MARELGGASSVASPNHPHSSYYYPRSRSVRVAKRSDAFSLVAHLCAGRLDRRVVLQCPRNLCQLALNRIPFLLCHCLAGRSPCPPPRSQTCHCRQRRPPPRGKLDPFRRLLLHLPVRWSLRRRHGRPDPHRPSPTLRPGCSYTLLRPLVHRSRARCRHCPRQSRQSVRRCPRPADCASLGRATEPNVPWRSLCLYHCRFLSFFFFFPFFPSFYSTLLSRY